MVCGRWFGRRVVRKPLPPVLIFSLPFHEEDIELVCHMLDMPIILDEFVDQTLTLFCVFVSKKVPCFFKGGNISNKIQVDSTQEFGIGRQKLARSRCRFGDYRIYLLVKGNVLIRDPGHWHQKCKDQEESCQNNQHGVFSFRQNKVSKDLSEQETILHLLFLLWKAGYWQTESCSATVLFLKKHP